MVCKNKTARNNKGKRKQFYIHIQSMGRKWDVLLHKKYARTTGHGFVVEKRIIIFKIKLLVVFE